ncbi:MAG: DAK2 domain-containing protein [Clostridia bacterium]|nr:DAK2 domain-containing protein [Clostridia bacterium]
MIREIDRSLMQSLFISAAHHLDNNKQAVNDLNVFPVPDGDTGTNMSMTFQNAEKALLEKNPNSAGAVVQTVASATLRGARGNSGVILSQIMRGFASALSGKEMITAADIVLALSSAAKTAYRAVMKPTEGTILTVIRLVAETISALDEDEDVETLFEAIVKSANDALAETPKMLPVLKNAGVVDAGGKGLVLIFEGMLLALQNGAPVEKTGAESEEGTKAKIVTPVEAITFGYCTEFIICKKVLSLQGENLKKEIQDRGDSVLVIDDADIIKVHIHTDHPGWVLERALSYGSLTDIKIDNLREQQAEQMQKLEMPHKKFGIVSVAAGDGVSSLMQELGADCIVSGGQTMNPSAEDLLAAVNTLNADKIFILPNNSNIVLTAEQAADMTEKDVTVIKTKTIPQGIAALMAFDAESEGNADAMSDAASLVKTGLLTNAVRDTEVDGISVHKDDYLGLSGGHIVASGDDEKTVMGKIFEELINEETVAVTILYGEGVSEEETAVYEDVLSGEWPDAEVNILYGGQPVYRYILSVE